MFGPGTISFGERTKSGFPVEIVHKNDFVRGYVKDILVGKPAYTVVYVGERRRYLYEIDLSQLDVNVGSVKGVCLLREGEEADDYLKGKQS